MLQKLELQQLQALSFEEIKEYKVKAITRKSELEAIKNKDKKAWAPELQEELDSIALLLVDIDDALEEKPAVKSNYKVIPGNEKMVHLSLIRGRRFNPLTGKEESKPFVQLFTFSEWQLFKKNYANLGYIIVDVLHDPYGDAKKYITKI